jgi:catechol 1,2-dioxygenase
MGTIQESPSAAKTGASASESFKDSLNRRGIATTSTERVAVVVGAVLDGIHAAIREHEVSYPEFQAAKAWLIAVGESGEWPLFLDVFVEHAIEFVAAVSQRGTKGTIEGPFYLPDQSRFSGRGTLPRRSDEAGTPLVLHGQVRDLDGTPLAGAEVDIWQADAEGYYSSFVPNIPPGNLRGVVLTDADGRYAVETIEPAPYQIPHDGPTGQLIDAAGWHPWRPAHLHVMVRATGHRSVTTQLYLAGSDWLDSDVARATKPELIITPTVDASGTGQAEYDFELESG